MLDFMVIGLPRSATTWAAAWLNTEGVHCVHDPLYQCHYEEWDREFRFLAPDDYHGTRWPKITGVSCTGVWNWPEWCNAHPARKVILHRDFAEVVESLAAIGLPPPPPDAAAKLCSIQGLHVPFTDLFRADSAAVIWDYATGGLQFDRCRHAELSAIEMQPKFDGLTINPQVTRRLVQQINEALP